MVEVRMVFILNYDLEVIGIWLYKYCVKDFSEILLIDWFS